MKKKKKPGTAFKRWKRPLLGHSLLAGSPIHGSRGSTRCAAYFVQKVLLGWASEEMGGQGPGTWQTLDKGWLGCFPRLLQGKSLKCSTEVHEPVQLADPTIGIVS